MPEAAAASVPRCAARRAFSAWDASSAALSCACLSCALSCAASACACASSCIVTISAQSKLAIRDQTSRKIFQCRPSSHHHLQASASISADVLLEKKLSVLTWKERLLKWCCSHSTYLCCVLSRRHGRCQLSALLVQPGPQRCHNPPRLLTSVISLRTSSICFLPGPFCCSLGSINCRLSMSSLFTQAAGSSACRQPCLCYDQPCPAAQSTLQHGAHHASCTELHNVVADTAGCRVCAQIAAQRFLQWFLQPSMITVHLACSGVFLGSSHLSV